MPSAGLAGPCNKDGGDNEIGEHCAVTWPAWESESYWNCSSLSACLPSSSFFFPLRSRPRDKAIHPFAVTIFQRSVGVPVVDLHSPTEERYHAHGGSAAQDKTLGVGAGVDGGDSLSTHRDEYVTGRACDLLDNVEYISTSACSIPNLVWKILPTLLSCTARYHMHNHPHCLAIELAVR